MNNFISLAFKSLVSILRYREHLFFLSRCPALIGQYMTALASDWLQPGLPADGQVPVVVPNAGGQAPELLPRHAPV